MILFSPWVFPDSWMHYSDLLPPVGHLKWWWFSKGSVPQIPEQFRLRIYTKLPRMMNGHTLPKLKLTLKNGRWERETIRLPFGTASFIRGITAICIFLPLAIHGRNSKEIYVLGSKLPLFPYNILTVINLIVGFYIPIIRIPYFKGGRSPIPKKTRQP